MIQRGNGLGLAFEALAELLARHLNRHQTLEPRISRFVDLSHAAGGDDMEDLVRTKASSGGKGQDVVTRWLL